MWKDLELQIVFINKGQRDILSKVPAELQMCYNVHKIQTQQQKKRKSSEHL